METNDLDSKLKEFIAANEKMAEEKEQRKLRPHPYYTEAHGQAAKRIVDMIAATKHGHVVKLYGGNTITAKIQWYQGCRYLREKLDPAGSYAAALRRIGCRAEPDQLAFYLKSSFTPDITALVPTEATQWKPDFLMWLDKPDKPMHDKFPCPPGVTLSEEDIEWGNQQLAGLETIYLWKFSEHEVMVVRYDNV